MGQGLTEKAGENSTCKAQTTWKDFSPGAFVKNNYGQLFNFVICWRWWIKTFEQTTDYSKGLKRRAGDWDVLKGFERLQHIFEKLGVHDHVWSCTDPKLRACTGKAWKALSSHLCLTVGLSTSRKWRQRQSCQQAEGWRHPETHTRNLLAMTGKRTGSRHLGNLVQSVADHQRLQ